MINVPDDVHKIIVRKQLELYEKEGKKTTLSEIAGNAIITNLLLVKIPVRVEIDKLIANVSFSIEIENLEKYVSDEIICIKLNESIKINNMEKKVS